MSTIQERLAAGLAGRYTPLRELGRGGMALVFLADDQRHSRHVAIKVLRPEIGSSIGAERFLREIAVTARLTHPHVLPLLDSGETDGLLFYVMPYIEGETLRDRMDREDQLPLGEALHIAREVADALSYAHTQGVVHRDIKPENVLLSSGHAIVADFGIARAVSAAGGDQLTQTGIAIGTPAYMSPEQMGDEDLDGRSDIYSLGCMLYEMLAGDIPFGGLSAMAIMAKKATAATPQLSQVRAAVPVDLQRVIERALARAPADRFATAHEFVGALDATGTTVTVPEGRERAIVVLPFVTMSDASQDEYLSDGITEDIIHALARAPGVSVVARTSAFAFKGTSADIRTIGQRLAVGRVVEGSVRRAGDRVRVTAQLVNVSDGFEVWSERYDRRVDDLFAIQDDISRSIADTLMGLLASDVSVPVPPRATPRPQPAAAAYQHYLRGRHFWNQRTADGLRRSVECLTAAVAADPGFPLAHAALADAWATIGLYGLAAPDEAMPAARAAAERALVLDPDLAEALTTRACVHALYARHWVAAAADFAHAVALNPQYPTAHQWDAMNRLTPLREFGRAHDALERARALDPLALSVIVSFAALHYYARDYARAAGAAREALELDPQFAVGHYFLGLALEQQGRTDEAIEALTRGVALSDSPELRAGLAHARAAHGATEAAARDLAHLEADATRRYVSPVLLAQVRLALGDSEGALALLDEALTRHAVDLVWLAVRPTFDPLRDHPRFVALIDHLGLPGGA